MKYYCIIVDYYDVYVFHIVNPPEISEHPSGQNVHLTECAKMSCSATGDNVNYQWMIGSGSFPIKVTGINTNTLVIPDVRSSDDNTYACTVSNDGGSVTSNPAKLTVTGMTIKCCMLTTVCGGEHFCIQVYQR